MILHHNIIKSIEGLIEEGHTVEIRLEKGKPLPGKVKAQPLRITVFKRADNPADLSITPILINENAPTDLVLYANKLGEDPIQLGAFVAPAGFYFAGLKGYQGEK